MSGKILTGSIFVIIGTILILNNLNIINFDFGDLISFIWPLLFAIWGAQAFRKASYVWGTILVFVSLSGFLHALDIFDFSIWSLIWPAIIIGIGVDLLLPKNKNPKAGIEKENYLNRFTIFSGNKINSQSRKFEGGDISCIFGGSEINLTASKIDGNNANINVNIAFGGAEIKVPKDWKVEFVGTAIFGGFEDKTSYSGKGDKTLTIDGTIIFGGLEIKN